MAKARVDSIEYLKLFRATLFKFCDAAGTALGDAESDIHRTINWLDNEQIQKWQNEHRKRQTNLSRAKEALRMKQVFKGAAGSRQSTVDEEKAVAKCTKAVQEAEAKIAACKQHSRKLQKELMTYKGQVQRFQTTTTLDIPMAAALLSKMITRLEAYASLAPKAVASQIETAASEAGGMAKPTDAVATPDLGEVFNQVRANTPGAAHRAAAQPGEVKLSVSEQLSDEDRQIIAQLAAVDVPAGDSKIIVHFNLAERKRVYLERMVPAFAGDSGWFLGPAEAGVQEAVVSTTIAEVLQVRPDWKELLSLPAGYLAVIDGDTIAAILDGDGKEVFADASMSRLMKAAESAGENVTTQPPPDEVEKPVEAPQA